MALRSVRGAITIEKNTRDDILNNTEMLLNEIFKANGISESDVVNIIFTATKDIDAAYPAVAARGLGIIHAGLVCMQEMYVEGSLNMCIRVLVMAETDKAQDELIHVYLKGAKRLRPDISFKESNFSVAIDGPAGSGKSTIAKMAAKELGFLYADTGAMYRAVGLYCLDNSIDCENKNAVISALDNIDISIINENNSQRLILNGVDSTDLLRSREVSKVSSIVAEIEEVRKKLVRIQKEIAEKASIVMDGRDIGTNVLPKANVKIYMDADVDSRVKRRCGEFEQKGIEYNVSQVREEIIQRDERDKNREHSPLMQAEDAVYIDTSNMNIDEVFKKVSAIIKEKMA